MFGIDSQELKPKYENSLPIEYKNFLKEHQNSEFLLLPILPTFLPHKLTPITNKKPRQQLGFFIEDESQETIFIVRSANSLVLRSLESAYLFANVFHYWNNGDELTKFAQSNKPMVIYDFDSFTPPQIIPLTFQSHPLAPAPIPIIDLRNIDTYQTLKLSVKYEKIYENICQKIAIQIIKDLNFDLTHISRVVKYLQKINIFQIISKYKQSVNNTAESTQKLITLPLLIELGIKFYLYNLNLEIVSEIVSSCFPVRELTDIIEKYQDNYNFVVISSYDLKLVDKPLFFNLILRKQNYQRFIKIWMEAKKTGFPLYGQHLDKISFFVRRRGETQDTEISLPDKICYQGQQEETIYAEYYSQSQNQYKTDFPLSTSTVYLPFKINGKPLINDTNGKEQIYKIENQYFNQTLDSNNLEIKIRFRLQPGLIPKLEVIDQHNRILHSCLEERQEPNFGYISFETILNSRHQMSQGGWEKLSNNYPQLLEKLKLWNDQLTLIKLRDNQLIKKAKKLREFRSTINKDLPPILNIESASIDQEQLRYLLDFYNSLELVVKNSLSELNKSSQYNKESINNIYTDILLFLGKSYSLTQNMSLQYLFDVNKLTARNVKSFSLHLQNIARISCNISRQKQYLNLFYRSSQKENREFYQITNYLWGYARILVWYLNFKDFNNFFNYEQHFQDIIRYCLSINLDDNRNNDYLQNALIILIYLLTFRENNSNFVSKNSESYNLAKQLCQQLKNYPIRSNLVQIKDNITLNELFSKLLEGQAKKVEFDGITID
jgi:hypothetical protein